MGSLVRKLSPLIFCAGLALSHCNEDEIADDAQLQMPQLSIMKFSLTETREGEKLWVLDAALANVYDEIIKVDTVRIKFFDEQQNDHATLTSIRGTLNRKTHNIIVRDSVMLLTSDSVKLYTDSLFWQNDSQRILTDSYVKILKPDGTTIEGTGLKTTPDLKRIEVIGTITGVSPIEFPKIK